MKSGYDKNNYSEDMFADTRMSFGEHIEDLRVHLWRAIVGFLICLFIGFIIDAIGSGLGLKWFGIGRVALEVIAAPVEKALAKYQDKRAAKIQEDLQHQDSTLAGFNEPKETELAFNREQLAQSLGIQLPANEAAANAGDPWVTLRVRMRPLQWVLDQQKANQLVNRPPTLSSLGVQEAFMVYFKVSLLCGVVLASPWVFWQIWSFVAAGLYPHEKRYVNVYLPFSLGLFLAGMAVCQFAVIPNAIDALLWFNEWLGIQPDLRLNEWLTFAIVMPLVFGVSFQTPLVMMFLDRIGIMGIETFRDTRRMAYMVLAVFAALITPSVDAFSMLFMWVPLCGLYVAAPRAGHRRAGIGGNGRGVRRLSVLEGH
jgi:sec-independent protein translocase protein TatC